MVLKYEKNKLNILKSLLKQFYFCLIILNVNYSKYHTENNGSTFKSLLVIIKEIKYV